MLQLGVGLDRGRRHVFSPQHAGGGLNSVRLSYGAQGAANAPGILLVDVKKGAHLFDFLQLSGDFNH